MILYIIVSEFLLGIFNIKLSDFVDVKPLEKLAEEVSIILGYDLEDFVVTITFFLFFSQCFVIAEPVQFKKKKDNTT